jgi:hypothetical protein
MCVRRSSQRPWFPITKRRRSSPASWNFLTAGACSNGRRLSSGYNLLLAHAASHATDSRPDFRSRSSGSPGLARQNSVAGGGDELVGSIGMSARLPSELVADPRPLCLASICPHLFHLRPLQPPRAGPATSISCQWLKRERARPRALEEQSAWHYLGPDKSDPSDDESLTLA